MGLLSVAWLLIKGWVSGLISVLAKLPWQAWACVGAIAALGISHWHGSHSGYARGTSEIAAKWAKADAKRKDEVDRAIAAKARLDQQSQRNVLELLGESRVYVKEAAARTVTQTREVTRVVELHPELIAVPVPADIARMHDDAVRASADAAARSRERYDRGLAAVRSAGPRPGAPGGRRADRPPGQ